MEEQREMAGAHPKNRLVVQVGLGALVFLGLMFGVHLYSQQVAEESRLAAEQQNREQTTHLEQQVARFMTRMDALGGGEDAKTIFADLVPIARDLSDPGLRSHLNEKYGERAKDIVASAEVLAQYEKAARDAEDAERAFKDQDAFATRTEQRLNEMTAQNKKQAFMVYRRFDTDASGRGYFEAYDVQNVRKCVLIADVSIVANIGNLQETRLYVKFDGDQPVEVQKYNAFQNFKSTEYMPTYEATQASSDIGQLQDQLRDAQSAKWSAMQNRDALNVALLGYIEKAWHLANLLDVRYTKTNLAEKIDEVCKRAFGTYQFKDGEFTHGRNERGEIIYMFRKVGMSVDDALGYARVMGAKDEHLAKSRRAGTTIAYTGKRGGVTLFLDAGKVSQVMFWMPEADAYKNLKSEPCGL